MTITTKELGYSMNDTLEILEKVNAFYSTSFDQLLIIVFGAIGLVGILIPLLITYYQSRQFNIEKKSLENYIDSMKADLISSAKEEITFELEKEKELLNKALKDNKEELNKSLESNKAELYKQIKIIEGAAFLIQANNLKDKNDIDSAIESTIHAIDNFIAGSDEGNLQRVLNTLTEILLPMANKNILRGFPDADKRIEHICKKLSKLNDNGRYGDTIKKIKLELKNTMERDST